MRAGLAFLALLLLPRAAVPAPAVQQQEGSGVVSSEIAISRERADIKLELADGRKLTFATVTGGRGELQRSGVAGDEVWTLGVERGGAVDRSWRELLNRAMEAPATELGAMLREWSAPGDAGSALDQALETALDATGLPSPSPAPAAPVAPGMNDSLTRLESKIQQLEEELTEARERAAVRRDRGSAWFSPLRHIGRGLSGIFATLVTFTVLFGVGFAVVMFGGRKYIEGVADTARAGIGRSFLVGLAGSFLLIPVFVLGVIALAISIVGIPALLVWIPLFPVATVAAVVLGYLGVAHAAGESWAERRYAGSEWFTRANSYYFMATGLALLSALFIAGHIITMAGPWLGFINNLLNFFGVMLTWAAATIGFGAVLISRGGKRSAAGDAAAPEFSEANV